MFACEIADHGENGQTRSSDRYLKNRLIESQCELLPFSVLSVLVLCGMVTGRVECNGAAATLISGGAALSGSSTLSAWLEGRAIDTGGSGAGGNGAAGGEASSDLPEST